MNLMQYLSVSGTLEGPREKFFSRRIGHSQEGLADGEGGEFDHPEPMALVRPAVQDLGQGEFGFLELPEIESKPSGLGNHLDLRQEEAKPRDREQVEVYSRISPSRVRVVRNDLTGSDLAVRTAEGVEQYRPSLIVEEPSRSSWSERMRGRFESLNQMLRWVSRKSWRWMLAFKSFWPAGIIAGSSVGALKVVPEKVVQDTPVQMSSTELDEAIEMAKDYKTDVYMDGRVAWSYEEYASIVKEIVPVEDDNDL